MEERSFLIGVTELALALTGTSLTPKIIVDFFYGQEVRFFDRTLAIKGDPKQKNDEEKNKGEAFMHKY
jgi:hypothetical protein